MTDPDPDVLAVDRLTRDIRAVIVAAHQRDGIGDPQIASALMYELAACLAHGADDLPTALRLVDETTAVMKDQIRAFASLRDHP